MFSNSNQFEVFLYLLYYDGSQWTSQCLHHPIFDARNPPIPLSTSQSMFLVRYIVDYILAGTTHRVILKDQPSSYFQEQGSCNDKNVPSPIWVIFQQVDVHAKQALYLQCE